MADCSLTPIADLEIGDQLLTCTESPALGQNRVVELAQVLATWRIEAPTVTITTESGRTVTASDGHRWLAQARPYWRRSDALSFRTHLSLFGPASTSTRREVSEFLHGYLAGATAGDGTMRWDDGLTTDRKHPPYWRVAVLESDSPLLTRLIAALATAGVAAEIRQFKQYGDPRGRFSKRNGQPPAPMAKVEIRNAHGLRAIAQMLVERNTHEWRAGWLSGFLDTDGTSDGTSIRWSQKKDNDYLERTVRYCADLGFEAVREAYLGQRATTVRLKTSDIGRKAEFIGLIHPALERKRTRLDGRRFVGRAESIVGLKRSAPAELIGIATSSGTLIAGGLTTHDSQDETPTEKGDSAVTV